METARTCSAAIGRQHLAHLMRRVSLGDDRAFSELHALTIHKMRKTALSVSSVSADIEDVLQDAYLKIWRHASRFDPEPGVAHQLDDHDRSQHRNRRREDRKDRDNGARTRGFNRGHCRSNG